MLRRSTSVLLYIVGGIMLMSEAMAAFITPDQDWRIAFSVIAIFAVFAVAPIALGALASPGRRAAEVGLVLMLSAGTTAAISAIIAYVALMPDTRSLFPPGALAGFGGYQLGVANLILLSALGYALYRKGRAAPD